MAKSDNTETMLRAIINELSAFKQEVLKRFDDLEKKLTGQIDKVDNKLTTRIDKIGKELAYLEDDAPTRDEFSKQSLRATL